ncbi:unnamed protein product [Bursaphelenchus xylophilus]|nr:unnamed protein product [Bursaphelenchus xylophilus]CAG9096164.1 unnamed protein product [Bursaphelenchus xylophilus]
MGEEPLKYQHHPSFIRLFEQEMTIMIEERPGFLNEIVDRLDSEFKKKMEKARNPKRDVMHAMMYCSSPERDELYVWMQRELLRHYRNDDFIREMLETRPEEAEFDLFFDDDFKLDFVAACLDPIDWAKQAECLQVDAYKDILNRTNGVYDHIKHNKEHLSTARQERKKLSWGCYRLTANYIIRSMMYSKPGEVNNRERNWFWDFIYIIYQSGVGNRTILPFIAPDIIQRMDEYISRITARVDDFAIANEEDMIKENEIVYEFRPQKSYQPEMEFLRQDDDDVDSDLKLRGYQLELAKPANNGENCVVCAPTGAGKTIVAIDVIKNHLQKFEFDSFGMEQEKTRAVFIVPTVPLVNQQMKSLRIYLKHKWVINGFYGGDRYDGATSRFQAILRSHVIVITPQLLLNMFKSILKTERLFVSDFSLVIFDECHHCTANHPYKMIMEYLTSSPSPLKPQIVGLTASLGIGGNDARDKESAAEHILKMCVAMTATSLSTVKNPDNLQELRSHVSPPVDEVIKCRRPSNDPFRSTVAEVLLYFFNRLEPVLKKYANLMREKDEKVYNKLKNLTFNRQSSMGWERNLDLIRESFATSEDNEKMVYVNTMIDHMKLYMFSLKMNDLLPAFYAYNYLNQEMARLVNNTSEHNREFLQLFMEKREKLKSIAYSDSGQGKEIVAKLVEILEAAYTENPTTQCLIFLDRRSTTQTLVEFILRSKRIGRLMGGSKDFARHLTSSNQSAKNGGMSSAEQKNIIRNFDRGIIRILAVTSVVEEGLDIAACNLIIKYNSTGSERTMIQRRGRARAKESKAILLALDEDVEAREINNMMKEELLNKVISELQNKGDVALKRSIMEKEARIKQRLKDEEDEKRRHRDQLAEKKYKIRCNNCRADISDTTKIRLVLGTYYVAVNSDIWTRIRISDEDATAKDAYVIKCGTAICAKEGCGHRVGEIVNFAGAYYPALKSAQLNFEEEKKYGEPDVRMNQQWTRLTDNFNVTDLSYKDQIEMVNSLRGHFKTFQLLKENEAVAIQKQREAMKRKRERKMRQGNWYDDVDREY